MDIIKKIESEHLRLDMPEFKAGDTVKVHYRIIEGEKERIQSSRARSCVVAAAPPTHLHGAQDFRRHRRGARVPVNSPFIDRVEVVSEGKVRRSRIYYLRNLRGKAARIKSKQIWE